MIIENTYNYLLRFIIQDNINKSFYYHLEY